MTENPNEKAPRPASSRGEKHTSNHTRSAADWSPVTKGDPCPICSKPDWCARSSDGAVRCMRSSDPPPGWRIVKRCDDGGTAFRRDEPTNNRPAKRSPKRTRSTPSKPKKIWPTLDDAIAELSKTNGELSATWTYENASGDVVGAVVRWDQSDGKSILPLRHGPYGWQLKAMKEPRPLFNLTTLLDSTASETVYVCEGEKCVDAIDPIGLLAVTSAGGSKAAAKTDWGPLAGRDVVILPDNDKPGEAYARDVVRLAQAAGARSVRVVHLTDAWPDMPSGGDLANFVFGKESPAASWSEEDIRAAIEALAEKAEPIEADENEGANIGAVVENLGGMKRELIQWLWPGRIALGKLTLLSGDPGLGKSLLTLDIAARVTTGQPWPDTPYEKNTVGDVVLLNAEDDAADTICPRLDAAGADTHRVNLIRAVRRRPEFDPDRQEAPAPVESMFDLRRDLLVLESVIAKIPGCRLVVIDPITAYMGGTDSHKHADVLGVLTPLSALASRRDVAIIAVSHLNKNAGGRAIYRSMGSLAFTSLARAVWGVTKDRSDHCRRLVLPIKANLAKDVLGMAYTIESVGSDNAPRVVWEPDPVDVDIDEELGRDSDGASDAGDAAAWLRDALAYGELPAAEVLKQGRENGFADKAIRKAFASIGGKRRHKGFGKGAKWVWSLPNAGIEKSEVVQDVESRPGDGAIDGIDTPV